MAKGGRKPYGHGAKERKIIELISIKRRRRRGRTAPTPYNLIAKELNADGFRTRDGKMWRAKQVKDILLRLEVGGNPVKKRYPQKTALNSTDYLSLEQIEICRQSLPHPIDRIIFETLLGTGLRASELCALRISDIDLDKKQIDVHRGKGCKQRSVQISEQLAKMLREYLNLYRKYAGRRDPIFLNKIYEPLSCNNLTYLFRILRGKTRLYWLHPHVMRHTFATVLYNYGTDLKFVREQLGHKSMDTTAIYAKISPERRLKQMSDFGQIVWPDDSGP